MFTIEFNNTNGVKPGTMTFENAEMATLYANLYFESITKIEDENTTYTAEEFLNKYEA
jgi:hypothetical protein